MKQAVYSCMDRNQDEKNKGEQEDQNKGKADSGAMMNAMSYAAESLR